MSAMSIIRSVCLVLLLISCKDDPEKDSSIIFMKNAEPVWQGKFTAADPSVIRDGDTLRMYYSSLVMDPAERLLIAGAKSVDGIEWIPSINKIGEESVALNESPTGWDKFLEAVAVVVDDDGLLMYYCGYPEEAETSGHIVAAGQIGMAKSSDRINFTRRGVEPVLTLGATNNKDANALFSPTVIKQDNTWYMFYVGYCIEECSPAFIGILAAASTDGKAWTKLDDPIISGTSVDLAWAQTIKEPYIIKGPDGIFYLFFSGDKYIGVARSESLLGPYEVYPEPILKIDYEWEAASVIAPSVLIENGKVRMWYMGVVTFAGGADFAIGYAESDFPMKW